MLIIGNKNVLPRNKMNRWWPAWAIHHATSTIWVSFSDDLRLKKTLAWPMGWVHPRSMTLPWHLLAVFDFFLAFCLYYQGVIAPLWRDAWGEVTRWGEERLGGAAVSFNFLSSYKRLFSLQTAVVWGEPWMGTAVCVLWWACSERLTSITVLAVSLSACVLFVFALVSVCVYMPPTNPRQVSRSSGGRHRRADYLIPLLSLVSRVTGFSFKSETLNFGFRFSSGPQHSLI